MMNPPRPPGGKVSASARQNTGICLDFSFFWVFFGSKLKFGKTQAFSEQSLVSPDCSFGKKSLKINQENIESHLKMWNYFV